VQEETVQSGYVPKEIYASIAIPSDILIDFWRKRNPDAAPEDFNDTERQTAEQTIRTQVENFVKNTLPRLAPGENEYTQVEVVFFETPTRAPLADPSLTETAMGWASSHWSTLSMLGLAAFSLLLLRNVARPRGLDPNGAQGPMLQLEPGTRGADAASAEDEEDLPDRPRLRLRKGDSLKEDLSEMVRENPDAAAAILRSWISNAG
jgi:flagellar M-ring protein FliF